MVNGTFTVQQPDGCSRTSCNVFVTMAANPFNSSYLDIYMEGTADGWVAVGFSNSRIMVRLRVSDYMRHYKNYTDSQRQM